MNKMKLDNTDPQTTSYHAKLEKWTAKELQLNVLHEEILNKREAMLRTSRNFLSSGKAGLPLMNNTDAAIRNDKLKKDMNNLEEKMSEHLMQVQSPRFATLQVNYWSMVKNMIPIWQKSIQEVDETTGKGSRMHSLEHV